MPRKPKISVIMPCYNEAAHIAQSIQSVYKQTFKNFELIIIDDGSTDSSLDVLAKQSTLVPNLRFYRQSNSGAGPARNHGIKQSSGEMIAFLDADDSWHPQCLAKLYAQLVAVPDAALAYCGWQNIGLPEANCKPFIPPDYEQPDKIATLLRSCCWPIHAALTRRTAIDEAGGFDERWSSCMDFDLWLRIGAFNKVTRVPEVLAYYHHHEGTQITKNRLRVVINHWKIQQSFIDKNPQVKSLLGAGKIRELTHGELLRRAYISYWSRDLTTAHQLFRTAMLNCHFALKDLKYLLPALLPFQLYHALIRRIDKHRPSLS